VLLAAPPPRPDLRRDLRPHLDVFRGALSQTRPAATAAGLSPVRVPSAMWPLLRFASLWVDGPRRGREAFSLRVPRPPLRYGLLLYLRLEGTATRRPRVISTRALP